MTYHTIVSEIERLPLNEQLLLLETLSRLVKTKLAASAKPRKITPLKLTRGMLKPKGKLPTDQELQDAYVNYLMEKFYGDPNAKPF